MRKQYVLGMTLIASLAFASCSKDEQVVQEGNGIETVQDDGQVLTLQVSNSGDGLTTRAGRPLLSSQAKQDINTIDLFVVNSSNKVVLKKTIGASEWANALDYGSTTDGHGKQLQISFKGSEGQQLPGSTSGTAYTIYAVAYKESSNYSVADANFGVEGTVPTTVGQASTNATLAANSFATTLSSNSNPADEIFAGKVEVKVVVDGTKSYITTSDDTIEDGDSSSDKTVPTLVLNRQVAGVTGYFTNIPVKVGEYTPAKLRLVASGKSNKVHFTSMVTGETDDNTNAAATSVMNGSWDSSVSNTFTECKYWDNSKTGYVVYDIMLSDFFKDFANADLNNDGFVGYEDAKVYYTGNNGTYEGFWENPNNVEGNPQTLVAGSVFAGRFIIPFMQTAKVNTLELQLLDKDNHILKNWNVKVPTKVTGSKEQNIADGIMAEWANDGDLIYNIYRNHLYSLGMKTADGDGGTKPDPDPEGPDTPEDLSKGQDLLINVNDNWEIIHNMEID